MPLTDDPNDPRLTHGADDKPTPMADTYLILSEEERAKGFIRPVRRSYVHDNAPTACHYNTRMAQDIAETFARNPKFYGATYCVFCAMHRPVNEFHWVDDPDQLVGS
jgi:hypothetical protein